MGPKGRGQGRSRLPGSGGGFMVVGGSAGVGGLFFFPKYPSGGSKVADSSPGIHLRKQGLPQDGTIARGFGF